MKFLFEAKDVCDNLSHWDGGTAAKATSLEQKPVRQLRTGVLWVGWKLQRNPTSAE